MSSMPTPHHADAALAAELFGGPTGQPATPYSVAGSAGGDAGRCRQCGEALIEGARYCEACGLDLSHAVPARIAHSHDAPPACDGCGGTSFDPQPDGGVYCANCGVRRPSGRASATADLGPVAAASDVGRRHHHNEDGFGLVALEHTYAAVVCDGVSSSSRPDTASHAAAEAAAGAFLRILDAADGEPDAALAEVAMIAAAGAAQAAAAESGGHGDRNRPGGMPNPPSTTFVAGVVTPDAITVGWVGDSRAYWIGDGGESACLTVDDTLAGQLTAAGVEVSEDAPNVNALIRWLGADATDTSPHVRAFRPEGSGRVIVCSDGLYRYASEAAALADITPTGSAIDVARHLVAYALEAGGGDNVTVTVLPYSPREGQAR